MQLESGKFNAMITRRLVNETFNYKVIAPRVTSSGKNYYDGNDDEGTKIFLEMGKM